MGKQQSNPQWTTYRILDATIMNVDVAAAADVGVGKLDHTALLGDNNSGTISWICAAGSASAGGAGGITTGAGVGSNNVGGVLTLTAGASVGSGIGAKVDINAGAGGTTGVGGAVEITAGAAGGGDKAGGAIDIDAGAGKGSEPGGAVLINAGAAGATGNGGPVTITSGTVTSGTGGAISLTASPGVAATNVGGTITLTAGAGVTSGAGGDIQLTPGDSPSGTAGSVLVGANTAGHDVKIFNATDGAYAEFDASADKMNFVKSSLGMTGALPSQGIDAPYIGIGTNTTPQAITLAEHVLGVGVYMEAVNSNAHSLIAGYFKSVTDGAHAATLTQLVGVAPRVIIDQNCSSAYATQSHLTLSGDRTFAAEASAGSFYLDAGTGSLVASDRLNALQAIITGTASATAQYNVAEFYAYADVDSILRLSCLANGDKCPTQIVETYAAGTAGHPITMDGIIFTNTTYGTYKTLLEGTATLTTADAGIHLTVTETGTHTSAVRGIHLNMTKTSGALTAAGEFVGIASDIALGANSNHSWAFSAYTAISGTPTLGDMAAYRCYCANLGATAGNVSEYQCLDLNIDSTNEATGSTNGNAFFRLYAHGARPTSIFRLADATGMDNLFWFQQSALPLSSGSDSTNCSHKIALIIGGGNTTTHYLHVFTD